MKNSITKITANKFKKIKLLLLTTTTVGGPGQIVLDLSRYLDRDKFDVSVAFGPGYPLDNMFQKEGIKTYHIKMSRGIDPLTNTKGLIQLYRLIKKEGFDIVHTHCSIASFVGRIAAKMANCPIIILHDQGFAFSRYSNNILQKYFYLLIERLLEPVTDYYITASNALEQIGIKHKIMRHGKISVIYNGIDPSRFEEQVNKRTVRKELGLDVTVPVFGLIGRLEIQKKVDMFLKAVSMIIDSGSKAQFLIVGDGPLRKELEELARMLNIADRVFFAGWRTDISRILGAIDIFCLTSLWEGMPLVVIEAMAMGKPVVSTEVRGIKEVVEDGKTGILVPLNDIEAFGRACIDILNNHHLATTMGEAGRIRFKQMFTVDRMINKCQSLYMELYNKKCLKSNISL